MSFLLRPVSAAVSGLCAFMSERLDLRALFVCERATVGKE